MGHRFEYGIFRAVQTLLLLLPLKSVQRVGAGLGLLAYWVAGGRRRIALENLRYAFPEKEEAERRRIARAAFQNYATVLMEFLWVPKMSAETLRTAVHGSNLGIVLDCYHRGKGVIIVSAHMGNWELMGIALGFAAGLPISIVVQTQNNRLVDAQINALRTSFGNKVVPMGVSVREIVRALANHEAIALAADQSGVQEGPFVNFFGRSVATHQGPAVFALRTGAPMVLAVAIRNADGTYTGALEEIPTSDLNGPSDDNIRILTQRHASALEGYIRRHPEQWLWLHRRWKHLAPPFSAEAPVESSVVRS